MNKEEFLQRLINLSEDKCVAIGTNYSKYIIEKSDTYTSDLLEEEYYNSIEEIGNRLFDYITINLRENIEKVC